MTTDLLERASRSGPSADGPSNAFGFALYLLFTASWFLHLGDRIQILGALRMDLLLIVVVGASIFLAQRDLSWLTEDMTGKALLFLVFYVLATAPFVEWPGSVLNTGLPNLIKAMVFYFFTGALITTRARLKALMAVFLAVQSFRVVEPLYLHVTTGYWGSFASMADWESMNRLSGSPYDVVNPNGLAFVICTVYPFFHFLSETHWMNRLSYALLAPALIYALVLTASRSGFLGLCVIIMGIVLKSRRRLLLAVCIVVAIVVVLGVMTPDQKDRYLSIFSDHTKNAATAQGRYKGFHDDLKVALRHPLVGHGLGTSLEANANFGVENKPAHNLYVEAAQEIGFAGLSIFLAFIYAMTANFSRSIANIKIRSQNDPFLRPVADAMHVWLLMNFLFSVASYGLTSYEWYFFAGLSAAMKVLTSRMAETPSRSELEVQTERSYA